jgi:altronate dehydratase small subunit
MTRAIVLSDKDNVATLIDHGKSGDSCQLKGDAKGHVTLAADIPFGHKVAIQPIDAGCAVVKHGEDIGQASSSIGLGAHVHVHNVESRRGRGDLHGPGATQTEGDRQ